MKTDANSNQETNSKSIKGSKKCFYQYLSDGTSFVSKDASAIRTIYTPLCGPSADHIKSSITPFLSGDIKIDKDRYLSKPASTEDLRHNFRNFFFHIKDKGVVSLADRQPSEDSSVEIGQLWHKLKREFKEGIAVEVLNFVPVSGENVELMHVKITNTSKEDLTITPTSCIPVFGRSLANKHDHEHVTSLLNRIEQTAFGIYVQPSMMFNEEGHKLNDDLYFVLGFEGQGQKPVGTFPTVEDCYGDSANEEFPSSIIDNRKPEKLEKQSLDGKEAVGAIRFEATKLKPGDSKDYYLLLGIAKGEKEAETIFKSFNSPKKQEQALEKNNEFWKDKTHSISFKTRDDDFNAWMHWVTLQPVLRRIYGCSFLPDHDYGKGGKGWRDIWQDLLSLLLIEPMSIRDTLVNNFAGVRVDGSNATIVGSKLGEFIADRNAITRVWMDHGVWPFITILLYIDQTGDYDILLEMNTYFKDLQLSRTLYKDLSWSNDYGQCLKDGNGNIYEGTLLEHLLVQNLVQFFNVGEHNCIRLENADWNDGFDMAFDKGESVAFMSQYGGNLFALADCIEDLGREKSIGTIHIFKELSTLIDSVSKEPIDYNNAEIKRRYLFEKYFTSVQPEISGEKVEVNIKDLIDDLRNKGLWIFEHIRKNEKILVDHHTWFNGYYDNKAQRVEGKNSGPVRMTLTGQVFPIMSGLADKQDIEQVIEAVDTYLKDPELGGYRLNSNFGIDQYLDLGRAFGFAFGTKENGSFFSHMNVMYAYSLYKRKFAVQGYEVIKSIYDMCLDTQRSKIYPGIPEYLDSDGKGMYHYLTGSASWLVLTMLTQSFGVRGQRGDLVLNPKLVTDQFDEEKKAEVSCQFAGSNLNITYINEEGLNYGEYTISLVTLNGEKIDFTRNDSGEVKIARDALISKGKDLTIQVNLT